MQHRLSSIAKKMFKPGEFFRYGTLQKRTLYHQLSKDGQLAGFEVHERFYEIGSFDGISDLEKYLKVNEE
jgi:hypothetical protein